MYGLTRHGLDASESPRPKEALETGTLKCPFLLPLIFFRSLARVSICSLKASLFLTFLKMILHFFFLLFFVLHFFFLLFYVFLEECEFHDNRDLCFVHCYIQST